MEPCRDCAFRQFSGPYHIVNYVRRWLRKIEQRECER